MHLQETNGVTFLYTMSLGKALCLHADLYGHRCFQRKFPFVFFPSGCTLGLLSTIIFVNQNDCKHKNLKIRRKISGMS